MALTQTTQRRIAAPKECGTFKLAHQAQLVCAVTTALPAAMAIYAFGSRAQGTANSDSDLDLAVLVAGYAQPLQLWQLTGELADVAGCAVDLLDLRAASTVMQRQVLSTGRTLWVAPEQSLAVGLFECFVMSESLALDAARAPLLADIAREGTVHGTVHGTVYG